jgi:hypothetical protein
VPVSSHAGWEAGGRALPLRLLEDPPLLTHTDECGDACTFAEACADQNQADYQTFLGATAPVSRSVDQG